MSSSWYNPKDCNKCSSVARAISPRGNVYMCRDHAANEEQIFYNPSVIQFFNNNKLKERDGSFKYILENEDPRDSEVLYCKTPIGLKMKNQGFNKRVQTLFNVHVAQLK